MNLKNFKRKNFSSNGCDSKGIHSTNYVPFFLYKFKHFSLNFNHANIFFIYSPLLRCSSECQDTIFFPYDFAFERNFQYWLKCGFSLNLSYSSSSSSHFLFSFISRCEMLIKKKYEKNKIANKLNHARLCNLWIKLELV